MDENSPLLVSGSNKATKNEQEEEKPVSVATRIQAWFAEQAYLLLYTYREMCKRKMAFMLGLMSCFIVVWVVILCMSALDQVSLVFLVIAEGIDGQYDVRLQAAYNQVPGATLNYHTIYSQLNNKSMTTLNFENTLSPRLYFSTKVFTGNLCQNVTTIPSADKYQDWMWMYAGKTPNEGCKYGWDYCVPQYCTNSISGVDLYAIDTEREQKMGFGRTWNYSAIPKGQVYVSQGLAEDLDLSVGDVLILELSTMNTLVGAYRDAGIVRENTTNINPNVFLPVTIGAIFDNTGYKISQYQRQAILIEYGTFASYLGYFMPFFYKEWERNALAQVDMYQYATFIYINYPTAERLMVYNDNNYDSLQTRVIKFASEALYLIGYNQVYTYYPILGWLYEFRFVSIFLGLFINVIAFILTMLAVILIYSLLMVNVENRTFEMGVLRMLGVDTKHIVQLILLQGMFYAVPGLIMGIVIGQGTYVILSRVMQYLLQLPITWIISWKSALFASALGLIIPIISSILPIFSALGRNLNEALDVHRSKTKAVKFHIDRNEETKVPTSNVAVALFLIVFGFITYYFLPLSLLSSNLTVFAYYFFGVIILMLLGLVVLALNLENAIEHVMTYVLLFWEYVFIRNIILKNLVAHRVRNRQTTIMYALSLGFIIFVSVEFQIQVNQLRFRDMRKMGSRLNVYAGNANTFSNPKFVAALENIAKNESLITGYAYSTYPVDVCTNLKNSMITNIGQSEFYTVQVRGISPQFYRTGRSEFIKVASGGTWNGLTLDEQLYSADGTGRALIGSFFADSLYMDLNTVVMVKYVVPTERYPKYYYKLVQPLAFMVSAPYTYFSMFPEPQLKLEGTNVQNLVVSFPAFIRMTNNTYSMRTLPIQTMLLQTKDSAAQSEINRIIKRIKQEAGNLGGLSVKDVQDELRTYDVLDRVMSFVFLFTTLVAMIMCFFSLMSSMYNNVYDQVKEIGILRALGATRFSIFRMFVYEALVLIISASFMGIMIGIVVAYTMTIQRVLFTQLPMDFIVPWQIILLVMGMAIIFALIASSLPVLTLLRENIVTLLRKIIT